jgi:hypothetical protein
MFSNVLDTIGSSKLWIENKLKFWENFLKFKKKKKKKKKR